VSVSVSMPVPVPVSVYKCMYVCVCVCACVYSIKCARVDLCRYVFFQHTYLCLSI